LQQLFSKQTFVFPGGNRGFCLIPAVDEIKVLSFCRFGHQRRSRRKRWLADGGFIMFQLNLIQRPFTYAPQPSMQCAVMRCYARNFFDGFAKPIARRTITITGGFNNWQTERLIWKKFNRKHSNATVALFAKCQGYRGLLVEGDTVRIKQDTVSFDQPGLQPKGLFRTTVFLWAGCI